jgi:hypothetical protein
MIRRGKLGQVPVAHAYSPSYSGGRDQEAHSSNPAQTNSSLRPYLEKPFIKDRAAVVTQGKGPEFKPQYRKKNQKTQKVVRKVKKFHT